MDGYNHKGTDKIIRKDESGRKKIIDADLVLDKKSRNALLQWFQHVKRDMPWRQTGDPYLIWLSEVMLQQTRVDQARPYFERFVNRFPDVFTLSRAHIDEVLLLWEGLGYYSRAHNLHKAAKQIVQRHHGVFPACYDELITLQGIGPYTASAIMSIAWSRPYAVVDGNVTRVISRLFAIGEDIRKNSVQKYITKKAEALLDRSCPGDFNQAMMELGAIICRPSSPKCSSCPLQNKCTAYLRNETSLYPWKSPIKKRPHYQIAAGVVRDRYGRLLIAKRPEKAMLGGLWEFPGGKQKPGESLSDTVRRELREELDVDVSVESEPFEVIRHTYSHFSITLHAFFATIQNGTPRARNGEPFRWIKEKELDNYAFPKANRKITDTLVKYHSK
ncbi:MAG: A/G-specific adenine glycosylase [Balneolales bacterium]